MSSGSCLTWNDGVVVGLVAAVEVEVVDPDLEVEVLLRPDLDHPFQTQC